MAGKRTGKPNGRPPKVTPEILTKLEQAFAIDCTNREACSYADISEKVFYDYLKRNPEFSVRIQDLKDRPILKARQAIVKSLDDHNSAYKYLEKKRRKEFGANLDITTDGEAINVNVVSYDDNSNNTS